MEVIGVFTAFFSLLFDFCFGFQGTVLFFNFVAALQLKVIFLV